MAKKKSIQIELESNKTIKFDPSCLEPCISSNLYRIGRGYIHDENLRKEIPCIFVTFSKKKTLLYIYEGHPLNVFNEFKEAPSKGKFLNSTIIPNASAIYKATISCLK